MAFKIPFHTETFRPVNDQIEGNEQAADPVEFDLCPAAGPDLARLKSVMYASIGLVEQAVWTEQIQEAVVAAFTIGAAAFVATVEAVRGLYVPASLAVKVGLIVNIPVATKMVDGQPVTAPDPDSLVAITNGAQFSRVCGYLPAMSLHVAMKVMELSKNMEQVDPRFFGLSSGSGGPATADQPGSSAGSVQPTHGRPGTVAGRKKARVSRQPGTSPVSQ